MRNIGNIHVIDLHNKIFERKYVNDLKNGIYSLIEKDAQNILINFTDLENIDAIGLGVLLSIQKIALVHNLNVRLYGLRPNILQIIKQTHLNRVMDICSERELNNINLPAQRQQVYEALIA